MNTTLKLISAIAVLAFTTSSDVFGGNGSKYNVNTEKSVIAWKGEKVTGEHTGNIKIKSGMLEANGAVITSGKIVIDMNSITNTDLEDASYNAKLVGHLKSDDFFGVEKHPTAILTIKKSVSKGGDKYEITGDITIKGTTQPITFPATITAADGQLKGVAEIVIDRSKFDVRYGSESFFDNLGDKVIYNNFTLNVDLVAKS